MHDDVCAVRQRVDEIRRRDGVVDEQWHANLVRDRCDGLDIQNIDPRIGNRLAEEQLGIRLDGLTPGFRVTWIVDECCLDAELRQRVVEQVVRAPIQARARHDVVTGLGDVEDRQCDGRRSARHEQRCNAAFKRRNAILDCCLRWVHDARVDVAKLLEPEQVRCVRGVVERV